MSELSLSEIRAFMLKNNCKVTNHALVKHFKKFLTNPDTQDEARKQFKTFVNILATIKNENGEKYLVLRKKYLNEMPADDALAAINTVGLPVSPVPGTRSSSSSFHSDFEALSPQHQINRQPPPYRPPPEITSPSYSPNISQNSSAGPKLPFLEFQTEDFYRECVDEFQIAMNALKEKDREKRLSRQNSVPISPIQQSETFGAHATGIFRQSSVDIPPPTPPKKINLSRESSQEQKLPHETTVSTVTSNKENIENDNNKISVKEAMQKFNRFASEEEAKIPSPIGKQNKKIDECDKSNENDGDDVTLNLIQHPKAKEWIVHACKCDYQKLSKFAMEFPILVKLKDPNSGWNALHWASKHGNADVVKLIAGTYKADVNERTNGGYTALHIAIQHEKNDIFELLSNVYKADRNLTDWSGKKPLEYQQKQTKSVSSSTYSKIKARKKHAAEKDLGFLRIGSLNARVKKTRDSFNNFMGGSHKTMTNRYPHHYRNPIHQHPMENQKIATSVRNSAPQQQFKFDDVRMHKSWGSADNIPNPSNLMPPPNNKYASKKSKRGKRDIEVIGLNYGGPHSTPTTPRTLRSPIGVLNEQPSLERDSDSDGACGFDDNWKRP